MNYMASTLVNVVSTVNTSTSTRRKELSIIHLSQNYQKLFIGVGSIQIVIGVATTILGGIDELRYINGIYPYYRPAIWSGGLYIISGILGIVITMKPTRRKLNTAVVVSCFTCIGSIAAFGVSVGHLKWFLWVCLQPVQRYCVIFGIYLALAFLSGNVLGLTLIQCCVYYSVLNKKRNSTSGTVSSAMTYVNQNTITPQQPSDNSYL
ncbi:uncharacterized protein LOC120336327 isoform X1 [Styela clava]|uniref:uncharacterized protein LOC120336327 isoform X1 n=1 Tax=Styela clava TaxID=7725 RepID=UPI0019392CD6|nr:uncharacterized protein LOC120336327 isoform X1 [Styela clava]